MSPKRRELMSGFKNIVGSFIEKSYIIFLVARVTQSKHCIVKLM